MFAVVEILGKQYKVQEGEIVKIDNLNLKKEEKYIIEKVLLLKKNKDIKIGTPALTDVKVEATVVDNKKDKKIIVIKF
ncbi:MAG: 50S ribosomal protein L21, partial [Actinomycetia bacterium]|nr:50S ribosomal protein L21 [Actinomycetes bacterium]